MGIDLMGSEVRKFVSWEVVGRGMTENLGSQVRKFVSREFVGQGTTEWP
jgi:hypothetical protein